MSFDLRSSNSRSRNIYCIAGVSRSPGLSWRAPTSLLPSTIEMEQIHKEKAQFSPDFLLHKCKKDTLIPAQQKRGVLHVGNPLDREEGATFGDPAPS